VKSLSERRILVAALSARLAQPAILVAVALLTIYGLLALTASNPLTATETLLTGPVTTPLRTNQWLSDSTNLMLTGLAVALVFRVGQFSLGAEGQVVLGALAAGAFVLSLGEHQGVWFGGLAAGVVVGFLWGAVPGLLKAYAGADEIVSTLMLNYIALNLYGLIIKLWLAPPHAGFVVSNFFPFAASLPTFGSSIVVNASLPIALLLCIGAAFFLRRTRTGFELRMVGANPAFAEATGLRVRRSIWLSMALSGAVAGLAGALVAETQAHRLILGLSAGLGYDGILVALVATNRPLLVPLAALAFGYLRTGGDISQITSNVPRELITAVQGILVLLVTARLAGLGSRFAKLRSLTHRTQRVPDVPA
jgi:general nucleoside transport system permease protein